MADTTNRIAGTAYLTVNGQSFMVVGEFSYNPSKVVRESLKGMDGIHGYKEAPTVPHISAKLRDSGGLSVVALNAMTNVTVVAELANGKTIIGRNMWTVEEQTVQSEDATLDVKWEGLSVSEN